MKACLSGTRNHDDVSQQEVTNYDESNEVDNTIVMVKMMNLRRVTIMMILRMMTILMMTILRVTPPGPRANLSMSTPFFA